MRRVMSEINNEWHNNKSIIIFNLFSTTESPFVFFLSMKTATQTTITQKGRCITQKYQLKACHLQEV